MKRKDLMMGLGALALTESLTKDILVVDDGPSQKDIAEMEKATGKKLSVITPYQENIANLLSGPSMVQEHCPTAEKLREVFDEAEAKRKRKAAKKAAEQERRQHVRND